MLDPLRVHEPLPLRLLCHPLGYPLELVTNSQLVIDAAKQNWGGFPPESDEPAMHVRIAIDESAEESPSRPPVFRAMGNLLSIVCDAANFAVCDTQCGFAYAWLTPALARDGASLRQRFLDAIVLCLLVCRRVTPIHASCVALLDQALLLCGQSGAGKTSLAFACALRGFTLVTDDVVYLRRDHSAPRVLGRPQYLRFLDSAKTLFPELASLPVFTGSNGDPTIELATAGNPLIETTYSASARAIVFLKRSPGTQSKLHSVSRDAAMQRLLAELPTFGDSVYAQFENSVGILVRTTEVAELSYWDLDSAVSSLRSLIKG